MAEFHNITQDKQAGQHEPSETAKKFLSRLLGQGISTVLSKYCEGLGKSYQYCVLHFRVCTGLTEGAYHLLTGEVYAEWVCDKCLNSKNIPLVKFKP